MKKTNNDFAAARKLFPHTKNIVYFNAASTGPFCLPVANAIRESLDLKLAATDRDAHADFILADDLRASFAKLVGAKKNDIGIGQNTSLGINIAAYGLPLKRGDEILVSETEFPASIYTWRGAAETRGLKLKFVPSEDGKFSVEKFKKAISPRSRVLALSWVQFFNGFKNDLAALSSICKQHGMYLVVDGIQGTGVEPINVRKLGIDIFTCGCQKWLLSPPGCGFFYLSENIRDQLVAPFTTWLDVDWQAKFHDLFSYDKPYFTSARRFEMGFAAILNMLGMKAAITVIQSLGVAQIQKHNRQLIDQLADYVSTNNNYRVTSSMKAKERSSIFAFTCKGVKELHQLLLKKNIQTSYRENAIRVSIHLYNNEDDINKLVSILEKFSAR